VALTAPAIVMPAAIAQAGGKDVGAASGVEGKSAPVATDGAQHNQVVGKVLADALQGGESHGHGKSLDALIDGLPGHGGHHGDAALDALASHGPAAVSNGDTAVFAAFTAGHGFVQTMDQLQMHADAPPAHG
jgi:hypothetical protein